MGLWHLLVIPCLGFLASLAWPSVAWMIGIRSPDRGGKSPWVGSPGLSAPAEVRNHASALSAFAIRVCSMGSNCRMRRSTDSISDRAPAGVALSRMIRWMSAYRSRKCRDTSADAESAMESVAASLRAIRSSLVILPSKKGTAAASRSGGGMGGDFGVKWNGAGFELNRITDARADRLKSVVGRLHAGIGKGL